MLDIVLSDSDPPYKGPPAASQRRSEQYYRERAEELRQLASRTPHAEVRQDLMALSLRYEHLAERAKAVAEKRPHWSRPHANRDEPSTDSDFEELPQTD